MPNLTMADPSIGREIDSLVRDHYPGLAKVRLGAVLTRASVAVAVKILGPLARLFGCPDAILLLDAEEWADTSEEGRRARLDHGLAGISVALSRGSPSLDAAGRPRLKRRPPDLRVGPGGFKEVLQRHGKASLEAEYVRHIRDSGGQLLLSFLVGRDPEPPRRPRPTAASGEPVPDPSRRKPPLRKRVHGPKLAGGLGRSPKATARA